MSVTLGNLGTTSLVGTPSSSTLAVKGVAAGSNISVSTSSTDVTISAPTPICMVSDNSGQSLTTGTGGPFTFNTVVYDPNSMFNSGLSRIYLTTPGVYLATFNVTFKMAGSPTGGPVHTFINNAASTIQVANLYSPTALESAFVCITESVLYRYVSGTDYLRASWENYCGTTISITTGLPCTFSVAYLGV